MRVPRFITAAMDLFGLTFMAAMTGLGLCIVGLASLAGFDPTRAAAMWGGFLNHFAAAEPDRQMRVLVPGLAVWLTISLFVGIGMATSTRRGEGARANG
jgi:hypothetical protein